MREIKFRAWDSTRNNMNYKVCVGNTDFSDKNYTCSTILIYGKWLNFDDYQKTITMQYTGLKDRHGVEIYEGDIVREYDDYDGEPAIIDWNTDDACFRINYDGESDGFYNIDSTMIEVIGNIYENPELLEATQ